MISIKKVLAVISLFLCTFCVFVDEVQSATYYINGATGNDNNSGSLENPWKTIDKANQILQAGDTVFLRSGTYYISDSGIDPLNTGTPGNMITYSAYNNEIVEFVANASYARAIDLNSSYGTVRSYIRVHGIKFSNFYHHLYIVEGDYNEISHCVFSGMYEPGIDWRGSTIMDDADFNWIHDCTFEKFGEFVYTGGPAVYDDNGVLFEIGWDSGESGATGNVIENCVFKYSGHHVFGLMGKKNVLRNNYLQNNNWIDVEGNYYGNRVLYLVGEIGEDEQNLLEGNRIGYAGPTAEENQSAGEGGLFSERWCIIRYNEFIHNDGVAMFIHDHGGAELAAEENYIYNNTYWYNGHDDTERWKSTWHTVYTHAILVWNSGSGYRTDNNVFKNNLFYQNDNETNAAKSIVANDETTYNAQIFSNNWEDRVDGDPEFVDISGIPAPDNPNQFDFALQSGSRAIDGGTYLTQANGSGSNLTNLVVDETKYFQDGWGNGAGSGASVEADWIAIGSVSNVVQVSSINYSTNTITLSSSMTWSDNANIWLYKNSSGEIVLQDSAPDQGAYEYDISVGVEDLAGTVTEYELKQNYPNPFNPTTTIKYSVPAYSRQSSVGSQEHQSSNHSITQPSTMVQLKVYDILGREVAILVNGQQRPGTYSVNFNAEALPSGTYIYRLTAGLFTHSKKMIVLR